MAKVAVRPPRWVAGSNKAPARRGELPAFLLRPALPENRARISRAGETDDATKKQLTQKIAELTSKNIEEEKIDRDIKEMMREARKGIMSELRQEYKHSAETHKGIEILKELEGHARRVRSPNWDPLPELHSLRNLQGVLQQKADLTKALEEQAKFLERIMRAVRQQV